MISCNLVVCYIFSDNQVDLKKIVGEIEQNKNTINDWKIKQNMKLRLGQMSIDIFF